MKTYLIAAACLAGVIERERMAIVAELAAVQSKAKRALQEIWMAETKKDALAAFDAFIETWASNTTRLSSA